MNRQTTRSTPRYTALAGSVLLASILLTAGTAWSRQPQVRRLPPVAGSFAVWTPGAAEPAASPPYEPRGTGSALSVLDLDTPAFPSVGDRMCPTEWATQPERSGGHVAAGSKSCLCFDDCRDGCGDDTPWQWQFLPDGLIYHSYLAGAKEPRCGAQRVHDPTLGWLYEAALGGRVGVLRYGTCDPRWPQGWQIDFEGAVFPRVETGTLDLVAADFRYGAVLTRGKGPHQTKLGFYHLSSHLGDEFLLKTPGVPRINYARDVLILGHSIYWWEDFRLYAEVGYGFRTDGGSQPWEFQFGIDYSPARPTGWRPDVFLALNGHLREAVDFGGNFTLQSGLQWRGAGGDLFRLGMHYYSGKSSQYEFFDRFEDQLGMGLWYDY